MPVVKALIAGSCGGNVDTLLKRAAAVNASKGPFDVLFCVGQFFDSKGDQAAAYVGPLTKYLDGQAELPVPIYFIGAWGQGAADVLQRLEALGDGSRLRYLGRAGVAQVKGLSVAFLDGAWNAAAFHDEASAGPGRPYHTSTDVAFAQSSIAAHEGDIDLLLTNEWPEGLGEGLPPGSWPEQAPGAGSPHAAALAAAARPRYHVASGADCFYTRQPYLNRDLGAGAHVTRFIGLAPVGSASKQKWLHALALTPAAEMEAAQLQAVPPGTTPEPYAAAAARRRKREAESAGDGAQDWRWQERGKRPRAPAAAPSLGRADVPRDRRRTVFVRNVPFAANEATIIEFFSQAGKVEDLVRKTNDQGRLNSWCHIQFATVEGMERACQLNGSEFMGRTLEVDASTARRRTDGRPVDGCWFCLSNADADVDLVASVGDDAYLAVDKGAISDAHVLVVSVEHQPCSQALSPEAFGEVERYLAALGACWRARGASPVAFERYVALRKSGGNHCHLNAIAVDAAAAEGAGAAFEKAAAAAGFSLARLPPAAGEAAREAVAAVVGDGEYFQALLPDGSRLVHPIAYGERHPLNFGREVLAALAGCPERADWKACAVCVDEERARTERFKAEFKAYDPMRAAE